MKTNQAQKPGRRAALATLSAFAIFSAFAPARARALDVSISPYVEANSGDAREYVYAYDKILSELIWDMKPLVSVGAAVNVAKTGGIRASAEASAGIPMRTGSMQDSDWLNLLSDGTDYKTTYSKHDADLEFAYRADVELGWDFVLPLSGPGTTSRISLVPALGFRFMNWKWNGNDGYVQHTKPTGETSGGEDVYPAWTEQTDSETVTGTAISSQQQYWMPTAGITLSVPVASGFRVDVACSGTLWASCYALDMHFMPKPGWNYSVPIGVHQYFDMMAYGWMVEPKLRLSWACAKYATLFAAGSWTKIDGLRGDTRYLANNATVYDTFSQASGSGGGAALDTLTFRLGAEFQLNGLIKHKP
jgi:outer membrane protease